MFWTACPAAPFTRLSSAEVMTTASPEAATPTSIRFVIATSATRTASGRRTVTKSARA